MLPLTYYVEKKSLAHGQRTYIWARLIMDGQGGIHRWALCEPISGGDKVAITKEPPSTPSTPSAQDHAIRIQLELFARLNSVDVFGGGFVIGVASSALNHA